MTEELKDVRDVAATYRDARGELLWLLYNHQGGHSATGQFVRATLGIGVYADMTAEQIQAARAWHARRLT